MVQGWRFSPDGWFQWGQAQKASWEQRSWLGTEFYWLYNWFARQAILAGKGGQEEMGALISKLYICVRWEDAGKTDLGWGQSKRNGRGFLLGMKRGRQVAHTLENHSINLLHQKLRVWPCQTTETLTTLKPLWAALRSTQQKFHLSLCLLFSSFILPVFSSSFSSFHLRKHICIALFVAEEL